MEFSRRVKDKRPQTENRRRTAGGASKTRKNILKPPNRDAGEGQTKSYHPISNNQRPENERERGLHVEDRRTQPPVHGTQQRCRPSHVPHPSPRTPCPLVEKPPAWGVETLAPLGGEAAICRTPQRLPGFPPGKHKTSLSPVSKRRVQRMTTKARPARPAPDQCSCCRTEPQSPSPANHT